MSQVPGSAYILVMLSTGRTNRLFFSSTGASSPASESSYANGNLRHSLSKSRPASSAGTSARHCHRLFGKRQLVHRALLWATAASMSATKQYALRPRRRCISSCFSRSISSSASRRHQLRLCQLPGRAFLPRNGQGAKPSCTKRILQVLFLSA